MNNSKLPIWKNGLMCVLIITPLLAASFVTVFSVQRTPISIYASTQSSGVFIPRFRDTITDLAGNDVRLIYLTYDQRLVFFYCSV